MMRRKILKRTVHSNFDVRRILMDGIAGIVTGTFGNTYGLESIQAVENASVFSERNVAGVIGPARIVGSANPLNCGLDVRRGNALRYVQQIGHRYRRGSAVDRRFHQRKCQQRDDSRTDDCQHTSTTVGAVIDRPYSPPDIRNDQEESERPVRAHGQTATHKVIPRWQVNHSIPSRTTADSNM